jgi:integrase
MIDSNARLMKVGVYHIKKKYPMKNDELSAYMAEQKTWRTSEDYFIQFLMALYGLRVNAVSGLRIKHLDFQNKLITFPDTKCRMRLPEKPMQGSVEAMLMQQIGAGPYDKERFVFKTTWTDDIYKRAHDLGTLVTSFIRQSQVFQFQTEKYVYSSHCFRKTLAYEDHLKTEKESLEKISLILDHVGKTAVTSYVG